MVDRGPDRRRLPAVRRRPELTAGPEAADEGELGDEADSRPAPEPNRRRFPDMGLKHRLADASYRLYDRARHKTAFESADQPGTASDFAGMKGHKYALLVTFRKDGTAVPTPVWFALLDERRFIASSEERTGKVRRIRRDPLLSHHLRELLPPGTKHRLVDVESWALDRLGLHDHVYVRVLLIRVQNERVAVL